MRSERDLNTVRANKDAKACTRWGKKSMNLKELRGLHFSRNPSLYWVRKQEKDQPHRCPLNSIIIFLLVI